MLQAMLLAAIVAAPLGSAALFLPVRRHAHDTGVWPAVRRFALAIVGTIVVAAAAAGLLRLLKASEHNLVTGIAALVFASLVWLPVTRRWSARAHVCWASSVFLFVVYLTYALEWTFHSHLGPASTVGGVLLWLLEVFAAVLCCAYLWEICDALGTEPQHQPQRLSVRVTKSHRVLAVPVGDHFPVRDRHPHSVSHRPLASLSAQVVPGSPALNFKPEQIHDRQIFSHDSKVQTAVRESRRHPFQVSFCCPIWKGIRPAANCGLRNRQPAPGLTSARTGPPDGPLAGPRARCSG